ncbi:hypothetical protein Adt_45178 [Abeliophyllum distichum]|uniref:Uncharacterized protein n=1 Tax=Abeliophyllum distichum TaxID=126358 RepID=A0ABD1PD02_9LAMI
MMQSCSSRACRVTGESKPPKFNAIMINCSRLIVTSEETHDRHSNNTPTRGSSFNARIAQIRRPLPLGLSHLAACPSHGTTLRTKASPTRTWPPAACPSHGATLCAIASPTGTRPPCSLLLTWSNASRKSLSH